MRVHTLCRNFSSALAAVLCLGAMPAAGDRLYLASDVAKPGETLQAAVMKPFDVFLVAERDSGKTQLSAVVFTLDVPEDMVVVGEELLVNSLLAVGTTRAGVNLVFRCTEGPQLRVLHFRMVPTRPVEKAVLRLRPDTRTKDLAVIACQDENYLLVPCAPESLQVTAR